MLKEHLLLLTCYLLFIITMSEVSKAIAFIAEEKGLDPEAILETVQIALAAAYRKDFGNKQQNIMVIFDPDSGDMKVWDEKVVVEDVDVEAQDAEYEKFVERKEAAEAAGEEFEEEEMERFNPKTEMMLTEAKEHKKTAKIDDVIKIDLEIPSEFGRMAAQTAKQVIIQKLREAERQTMHDDFKNQEGEVVTGTVQRREARGVLVDFGKISGLIPPEEQIRGERYMPGARLKVYVVSVDMGTRGPEIVLSRSHNGFVSQIFEMEIPEVASGVVQIKGISRDAGWRSKVAVWTEDDSIDPIGSCIGQRGSRIQVIIDELGGEKVDIIMWDEDVKTYIGNALSPAKINNVELDEETKTATVNVSDDQFSLAIGRGGQNVRLAASLTGWKINVVQEGKEDEVVSSEDSREDVEAKTAEGQPEAGDVKDEASEEGVEESVEEAAQDEATDASEKTVEEAEEPADDTEEKEAEKVQEAEEPQEKEITQEESDS